MIAEVCQHTSWTWDYVDTQICLHRLAAIRRQWRRSPPLQMMVQAYLQIEGEHEPAPTGPQPQPGQALTPEQEAAAIAEFARQFAAAGGTIH